MQTIERLSIFHESLYIEGCVRTYVYIYIYTYSRWNDRIIEKVERDLLEGLLSIDLPPDVEHTTTYWP